MVVLVNPDVVAFVSPRLRATVGRDGMDFHSQLILGKRRGNRGFGEEEGVVVPWSEVGVVSPDIHDGRNQSVAGRQLAGKPPVEHAKAGILLSEKLLARATPAVRYVAQLVHHGPVYRRQRSLEIHAQLAQVPMGLHPLRDAFAINEMCLIPPINYAHKSREGSVVPSG